MGQARRTHGVGVFQKCRSFGNKKTSTSQLRCQFRSHPDVTEHHSPDVHRSLAPPVATAQQAVQQAHEEQLRRQGFLNRLCNDLIDRVVVCDTHNSVLMWTTIKSYPRNDNKEWMFKAPQGRESTVEYIECIKETHPTRGLQSKVCEGQVEEGAA